MEMVPPLAELDPERCYVSWEMVLASPADRDAVHDVFIFVEDSCELAIDLAAIPEGETGKKDDAVARGLQEPRAAGGGRRTYDKPDTASSLRVPAAKLDQFVDLVGELVTVQARLAELAARSDDPEVAEVSEEIERLTSALRENSMNIRMLPIRATFEKFRRLVHDLARDLAKDVELTMEGADTELDKSVIEQLGDPLMHLIRNSMDHGIEPKNLRLARGKRATAKIHLSARHSGASVLIAVSDDGGGINSEAVRQHAVDKGMVAADAQLSEAETFALIFQPGFSTAQQVTDVSGRGVGMDVVRQRVEALRGTIEVASQPELGTSVTLRLPLTLAIIDGLLVSVGEACFVLPLASTLECIELSSEDIERANGKHVANVRGEIVPYIRLREHFNVDGARPKLEQIMIVESGEGRFGFAVDQVLGNCQTVIKSLGRVYRHVQAVSGATILGNGQVALILDPERLVQDALRLHSKNHGARASPWGERSRGAGVASEARP
jgi:two-component system chemotaxis sensor kinase CheA